MNKSVRNTVLLTMLIDMIGVGVIIPVMPYYVKSFGVSPLVVTLVFAVYSLCAVLSTPLLGALSDRIGRRPVLLMSIASTALGWLVFALAGNVWVLVIGRVIDGLAAGNFSTAQSYLVDLAGEGKERAYALGLSSMVFGVGAIVGPMIGGVLGELAPASPFWFVCGLATINLLFAARFLPETLPPEKRAVKRMSINPFSTVLAAFRDGHIRPRLIVWTLFSITITTQQAIFALFIAAAFGYGALAAGLLMVGVGTVIVLNQAFLMKRVWLRYFSERELERRMFVVMMIGLSMLATGLLPLMFIGLLLHTLGQSCIRAVTASLIAGQALDRKGEIMGVLNSLMYLMTVVAAPIAGLLFGIGITWPYVFAVAVTAGSLVMLNRTPVTHH